MPSTAAVAPTFLPPPSGLACLSRRSHRHAAVGRGREQPALSPPAGRRQSICHPSPCLPV